MENKLLVTESVIESSGQRDIFFRFSKGKTGASHTSCGDILNASYVDSSEKFSSIYLQNYPYYIRDDNYEKLAADVIAFNRMIERVEEWMSKSSQSVLTIKS